MDLFIKTPRRFVFLVSLLSYNIAISSEDTSTYNYVSLKEIVVTPHLKPELLRDVPVSASIINSDALDAILSSGDDIRAFSNQSHGLYIESSNGRIAPRFYIRGLGNIDFDLAASQPVSVIFDDVVQENVILKSFPIFDLNDVEIIRGPQGTLYGRNTTAGIVKFTTNKPTSEPEGSIRISYGTFNNTNTEAILGGSISDNIFGRLSILSLKRDDWIDNSFTGENDFFGGHNELAARGQLLFENNGIFSAHFSYHVRDLNGSQTAFRANIFDTGSNELNNNYDRDTVFYDDGDDNTQKYNGSGSSIKLIWNINEYTLESITAYEESNGSNTGDIDGGVEGVGPGFIPFSSATIDAGNVNQFTHEIRIRSKDSEFLEWQLGAFYFDSKLSVTTDAGFNIATVYHANNSWALFYHNTLKVNNSLNLSAGLRYSDDQKKLTSNGISDIDVSDDNISWDLGLNIKKSEFFSIYSRIAEGYRAPSIQGRNIAFFGDPSVAGSESILSFETGLKADIVEDIISLNASIFYYKIDGFQLSAIGGSSNSNILLNADKGIGKGFEFDFKASPTKNITITAGFSLNDTEIKDNDLYTETCGSGQCTPTDPLDNNGNANIDGNPFPGAPKTTFNMSFLFKTNVKNGGYSYFFLDAIHQGKNNLALYESEEFITDSQYEIGLRIGYKNIIDLYELSLFSRNLTDEDNVKGYVDFNNNTGFVNEPRIVGIEAKYYFF